MGPAASLTAILGVLLAARASPAPRAATDLTLPRALVCKAGARASAPMAAAGRLVAMMAVPSASWEPLGAAASATPANATGGAAADASAASAPADECTLAELAGLAEQGDDDDALLGLALSHGPLLADLGRLAGWPYDLALDPWLREHCRQPSPPDGALGPSVSSWCTGARFDEVVAVHRPAWSALGGALYTNLQPSLPRRKCHMPKGDLSLAVIGTDGVLSTAVATAVLAAFNADEQKFQVQYFGHWTACDKVANCEEPLAKIVRAYHEPFAEGDAGAQSDSFVDFVHRGEKFMKKKKAKGIIGADVILCTGPYLICWMIRQMWPNGKVRMPMLHYCSLERPLLYDIPEKAKRGFLTAFRGGVMQSPGEIFVSTSTMESAWMLSMMGVAVPYVRPHAPHLRDLYVPPLEAPATLRALVLGSTWTASLAGEAFRSMLGWMLHANGLARRIEVEWPRGDTPLPRDKMAKFHAAVLFPGQPGSLAFAEQYEMAMPLWLPRTDFWVRIHALGEFRGSAFARRYSEQLREGANASAACGLPSPLFFRSAEPEELHLDAPVAAAFWFHLTDYALFPRLQQFGSAAELVQQLIAADLGGISRGMAAFNDRTWRASKAFYRKAFCLMLSTSPHSDPLTPQFMPQPAAGNAEVAEVRGSAEAATSTQEMKKWSQMCGSGDAAGGGGARADAGSFSAPQVDGEARGEL